MATDYARGRYNVFDAADSLIGRIDEDEFVRSGRDLLYRIDGDEVYGVNSSAVIAYIEEGIAKTPQGELLFTLREE